MSDTEVKEKKVTISVATEYSWSKEVNNAFTKLIEEATDKYHQYVRKAKLYAIGNDVIAAVTVIIIIIGALLPVITDSCDSKSQTILGLMALLTKVFQHFYKAGSRSMMYKYNSTRIRTLLQRITDELSKDDNEKAHNPRSLLSKFTSRLNDIDLGTFAHEVIPDAISAIPMRRMSGIIATRPDTLGSKNNPPT